MEHFKIIGTRVTSMTTLGLNDYISEVIAAGGREPVMNVNINCINLAQSIPWMKKYLNDCHVVFCDGEGVRFGARLYGRKIIEKITYNRWIWELAKLSAKKGYTWYLLGARAEVVEKAALILESGYPGLKIKGYRSGYFDWQEDSESIISEINALAPNILLLGLGMPKQEQWLLENLDRCKVNIALSGGGAIDYISGEAKMTPEIFYQLKLEWFYRWLHNPIRLFKRYFIGNPMFFLRIMFDRLKLVDYG